MSEYIADGGYPGIGFACRRVEYEALRYIVDMVAAVENQTLCLIGKRLHRGDDVGADMSRNLLEHHQTFAVPSVAAYSEAFLDQRENLLEAKTIRMAINSTFHTGLSEAQEVEVSTHHVMLGHEEGSCAEFESLEVFAVVLIEDEVTEIVRALHEVGDFNVHTVEGSFSNLIGFLEYIRRRPRLIAVGILYEIAGVVVILRNIGVFTDETFSMGLSVGHRLCRHLFGSNEFLHIYDIKGDY